MSKITWKKAASLTCHTPSRLRLHSSDLKIHCHFDPQESAPGAPGDKSYHCWWITEMSRQRPEESLKTTVTSRPRCLYVQQRTKIGNNRGGSFKLLCYCLPHSET